MLRAALRQPPALKSSCVDMTQFSHVKSSLNSHNTRLLSKIVLLALVICRLSSVSEAHMHCASISGAALAQICSLKRVIRLRGGFHAD